MTSYFNTDGNGILKDEPVAVGEALRLLLLAILGVLAVFDVWVPTQDQVVALVVLYGAVSALVSALTRRKVTPTAKL